MIESHRGVAECTGKSVEIVHLDGKNSLSSNILTTVDLSKCLKLLVASFEDVLDLLIGRVLLQDLHR